MGKALRKIIRNGIQGWKGESARGETTGGLCEACVKVLNRT